MAGSTKPATWATPLNRVWTEKLAVACINPGAPAAPMVKLSPMPPLGLACAANEVPLKG